MRTPSRNVLLTDLIIQSILVGSMLFFYLAGFLEGGAFAIALLIQLLVGITQVVSGVLHSVSYQAKTHQRYTAFATTYVAILIVAGAIIGNLTYAPVFWFYFIVFVLIIPVCIACWYWNLTYTQYKKTNETTSTDISTGEADDVLDDMEWIKNS